MAILRTALSASLALLALLAGVPGSAQLAPGSPWQKSKWDFQALYQGNADLQINPEILMALDQSGSTSRIMYHPLFPNNWQDENSPNSPADSQDYTEIITIGTGATSASTCTSTLGQQVLSNLSAGFSTSCTGTSLTSTISATQGTTYTIGGARTTVTVGGVVYPTNCLIKPDGTEVTYADVSTAFPKQVSGGVVSNAIAWMMCASHLRLRLTKYKTSGGTTTNLIRDIDFPLYWKPIDPTCPPPVAGGLTVATATGGIAFDTQAATTNPSLITTSSAWASNSAATCFGGYNTSSTICSVRSRYIEWVFTGTDPATGYYCIPNAIPSTVAGTQSSIDPTSVAPSYVGARGIYTGWSSITSASTNTAYLNPATAALPSGTTSCPPKGLNVGWFTSFDNGLPNRSRCQGIKEAVVKTWLSYSTHIMFAYRFLDTPTLSNALTGNGGFPSADWNYINTTADLATIASFGPNGGTPLIETFLNSLCQMTNPAAFSAQIATNNCTSAQLECQHHFVILLTDGAPSSIGGGDEVACSYPYNTTSSGGCYSFSSTDPTPGNAAYAGNSAVKANLSRLAQLSTADFWNLSTFAGIAAHGGADSASTWISNPLTETLSGSSMTTGNWLPFWVTQRTLPSGTVYTLKKPQPVQTMTVGVSLGVDFLQSNGSAWTSNTNGAPTLATAVQSIANDVKGSKFRLMTAAMTGNPELETYSFANAVPFYLESTSSNLPTGATYFFDGRDPATLVSNLDYAFKQIGLLSSTSTSAIPVFPTLGAGLGNEVYAATFQPPTSGGPLWTGDVLMYPTVSTAAGTQLLASNGTLLTGALSALSAGWSAAAAVANLGWLNRTIYTRLPSTSGTPPAPPTPLVQVIPGSNGTYSGDPGYASISSLLPGSTAAIKLQNWQYLVGGDVGSGTIPLTSRAGMMGDVIDSTPVPLQYSTMPTSITSTVLNNAWNANKAAGAVFRVVFVGDNAGLFHAFGEVSYVTTPSGSSNPVTMAAVDELWAFVPTEILPNINQLSVSTNSHRYAVDGPPTVYLLDLPQSATQVTGNGVFDVGPSPYAQELAVVIFGLGKGGRSYYALNVNDPGNPKLQWTLCPNEEYNVVGSGRLLGSSSASVIGNMGLATAQPSIARVSTLSESPSGVLVDAVLLGGGYSDNKIEAALPGTAVADTIASVPATTTLGRSAIAVDVKTGQILKTWDTSAVGGAGPVATALVPLNLNPGTGITDRAYYTDYYGTLWRLGGTTLDATYSLFRIDTPIIDNWNARAVYSQPVVAGAAGNSLISTYPTPFLTPGFPAIRTTTPVLYSPAVGIAFVTGDRNNPLDDYTNTPWKAPVQHTLNVVFDRQDQNTALNFSNLSVIAPLTVTTLGSGSPAYLTTTFGYAVNFAPSPGITTQPANYIPKGINAPTVLDGNLFYSVFDPSAATCNGGDGLTTTYQICNVMLPYVNTAAASSGTAIGGCLNGAVLSWTGVASNINAKTILVGAQAGNTSGSGMNNDPNNPNQNLTIQNVTVNGTDRFPKTRIWRTVH